MQQHWRIALGAGLVSAIVFVSASTGPVAMRALLFALTPLAIALAGLGWGWRTGALAGVIATIIIAALTGQIGLTGIFAATQAAPIVTLVYLAGLSRPHEEAAGSDAEDSQDNNSSGTLDWYPVGRLVIWAVGLAVAIVVPLIIGLGASDPSFTGELEKKLSEAIKSGMSGVAGGVELNEKDLATMAKLAMAMMPGGGVVALSGGLLLCLWLAARVTQASGQFERPWPDVAAIAYPTGTALALVVAMGASLLPPPVQILGSAATGGLLFAYLLMGLAVVHYTTRGTNWRPFVLWALYIGILFVQGVVLLVMLLGISETFLQLRTKYGGPAPPPPTQPNS